MYDTHKRPSQLDESLAIADADWMIMQKNGSNLATRVPVALLAAHLSGSQYRAASIALAVGDNVINFSSALPDANYKVHYYTRDADGYAVGAVVDEDNLAAGSFPINAKAVCTLNYYAIPNR